MSNFSQRAFFILFVFLTVSVCPQAALAAKGPGGTGAPGISPPPEEPSVSISQLVHNFGEVMEGTEVVHDFAVKNNGKGVLNIERVKVG